MSSSKSLIVAEIAQSHDGSIGILYSLIDACKQAGVDAVKFQFHNAFEESLPSDTWRVPFSIQDKCRYDYWKRMQLSDDQWREIRRYCDRLSLHFIASPFSEDRLSFLASLNPYAIKIASPDLYNPFIVNHPDLSGANVIISTGMCHESELSSLLSNSSLLSSSRLTILHCVSAYPSSPSDWCLSRMLRIGATFPEHYVGLSDHSGTIYPSIFALSHQASMIEVHVTFDKRMFGPDSPSSLDFDQLHSVVEARNMLSLMKNTHNIFNKQHFSRSLVAKRHIPKDQQVSSDLLTAKKPFIPGAIPAGDLFTVVGRTATQDIPEQTVLLPEFFQ